VKKWLLSIFLSTSVYSANFGVMSGYYNLSSKGERGNSKVSSLGSYRFFYHHNVTQKLTADFSYTILYEKNIGGDSSYGFDIGMNYFPFPRTSVTPKEVKRVQIKIEPKYSPYVGLGYHQRQYQSISTAYSGPGVKGGSIFTYKENLDLIVEGRHIFLSGPASTKATESSLNFGIIVKY